MYPCINSKNSVCLHINNYVVATYYLMVQPQKAANQQPKQVYHAYQYKGL